MAKVALWFREKDRKQRTANVDATGHISSMRQASRALTGVIETCQTTKDFYFKVGHIGKLIDIRVNTTDLPLLIKTGEDMGQRVVAEWTADLQSLADMIEKVVPSVSKEALTTLLDVDSPTLESVSDAALFTRAHNGHRISFCKRLCLC